MLHRGKNWHMGFTVQEMLLVVLISVVLLSVSIVGIVSYMHYLQITALDDSAKEIFLAAQNRAALLSSGQRLEAHVVQTGNTNQIEHVDVVPGSTETTQITVYYVHSKDAGIEDLLPEETIEPSLWEGDFYIIYEPESGSVVDVFFTTTTLPVEGDFSTFYETWRAASKVARMDSDPMIGYYGGESAESGSTISLRTPVINIYNENTLRAEVTYWVPRTLASTSEADNVDLAVTLNYQGVELPLEPENAEKNEEFGIVYFSYTYTWVLDTLEEGQKFRDLFPGSETELTYGGDFTISAEVSYTGDLKVNGARKTARDNSLFAKDSSEGTAYIAYLRHLQNLDSAFSGVQGKTIAVQQTDIQKVEGYTFQPINNIQLQSYDGAGFSIYGLQIGDGSNQPSGLFGNLTGTEDVPKELRGVRLVDTTVTAGNAPAGALLGTGKNLNLSNCQVYWENHSDESVNLQETLGNSADGLKYQISGNIAGGLAGKLENTSLTDCSASTLVDAQDSAGGLVGEGSGLTLTSSYSSSYLRGPAAGGLAGNLTGSASSITACYAVGFLESTGTNAQAAGLCLGSGETEANSSYSAMLFTVGNTVVNYPLCQNGHYTATYYLDSELFHFESGNESLSKTYSDLTDATQWETLFGPNIFCTKSAAQTHPYNLQTTLSLTTYIYPGLEKLDHWGDWGAQFQNGSLVYYERYEDNTYGFSGGDVSHLSNKPVTEDGYAVAYRGTESISGIGATLEITYQTVEGQQKGTFTYNDSSHIHEVANVKDTSGEISNYYLLPLPSQVVNTDYAAQHFYQKITITDVVEATQRSYYYNPHFANAILTYEEDLDLNKLANQLRVEIRSPRHLYMLSCFPAYYASTHQYRFLQQLDLDYGLYTAYEMFQGSWTQPPIGINASSPFRGSYFGNFHTIQNARTATTYSGGGKYQYVALFGYSTSLIQNVIYKMSQTLALSQSGSSSTILYGAGLVGYNGGTVDNCAVSGVALQASCYSYSTIYLGGLAGLNEGTIRSSSVEVRSIFVNANLSNAYAGGFVGRNTAGGTIDQCYAVGKIVVSRARYGTVHGCGFAGKNASTLNRSYAAMYLSGEGGASVYGFSADASTNCVYLNEGNFTYRNENYTAQYQDSFAKPVTWKQLSGEESSQAVTALGMSQNVSALDSHMPYPYPGTVEDSKGLPIHAGQWPDRMTLVDMGVYYWEKLTINNISSYHFYVLSLNSDGQVEESSTLSTAHGDNGVVTEYGYGYYHAATNTPPTLESEDLYWNDGLFSPQRATTNQDANNALAGLMSGQYTFYSYNTWEAGKKEGLHLVMTTESQTSTQPPVATWTLNQGGILFTVKFNPFFAASMAYGEEPLPGTSANPYQVRSIEQLQFINWYAWNDTKTVDRIAKPGGGEGYLFLNNWLTGNRRQYVWVQTHDLDGSHLQNYTPIAALYDTAAEGKIIAWFSGSYNGNDYTIQEVSISTQNVNTTGLFGVTVNAELKNIVLYSPTGKATITAANNQKAWYAIGGLVGLAANTGGSTRSIENCAVAGYTILDKNTQCEFGGGGVGGLVGICNMALKNCVAVTDIELDFTHSDSDRNVRVGGIAGSCQQSISNCYSGGSITLGDGFNKNTQSNLHVGGITGGYFMKTLSFASSEVPAIQAGLVDNKVPDDLITEFSNCYTYIQISQDVADKSSSFYAIGGLGEIWRQNASSRLANYQNCYYLFNGSESNPLEGSQNPDVELCAYSDLSVGGKAFNTLLDAGFGTITTQTAGGESIAGRYSFCIDESLLGKDYPFPTILTQTSSVVAGGMANVHYGDWMLEGIRREYGALPVSLDLFADYDEQLEKAVWTETLTLSGVAPGGTWNVSTDDPTIAVAELSGHESSARTLNVTAKKEGSTQAHISYTYNNITYTLAIDINVTAYLRLSATPSTITAFTDGTVTTPLILVDRDNRPLPEQLTKAIQFQDFTVEFDHTYFTQAEIRQENGLVFTATGSEAEGTTQMTAGYTFSYLESSYYATSVLALETINAKVSLSPLEFTFQADAQTEQSVLYTAQDFTLLIGDEPQTVENVRVIDFEEVSAEFKDVLWVEWDNSAASDGTLSITAYPQKNYPAVAMVKLQFQFDYAGNTHTLWQDLPVQVLQEEEEQEEPQP